MEMEQIVNLVMNSGVSIVVIAYFIFRDYKFMTQLQNTLQSLVDAVNVIDKMISVKKED